VGLLEGEGREKEGMGRGYRGLGLRTWRKQELGAVFVIEEGGGEEEEGKGRIDLRR
jgi:hypothetical protein